MGMKRTRSDFGTPREARFSGAPVRTRVGQQRDPQTASSADRPVGLPERHHQADRGWLPLRSLPCTFRSSVPRNGSFEPDLPGPQYPADTKWGLR